MSKRRQYLLVSLIGLVALLVAAPAMAAGPGSEPSRHKTGSPSAPTATERYAPGRVLVQFRPGVTMAGMRGMAASADAAVLREITNRGASAGRLLVVQSTTATTAELVMAFSSDSRVRFAEPDYVLHVDATPNDTRFAELWGMQQISAPGAWDITTGSSAVVIADLDTGVDYTHPDLAANMWHNPVETPGNGIDDDANGYIDDVFGIDTANADSDPMDDQGHGSHTSGTVAAVGNNGVGVVGVAWQARIMALKFLDSDGSGYTSDAIACINYAIAEDVAGIDVAAINASWGGGGYSSALRDAINAAGARGIVFVAAAGNGGGDNVGDDNDVTPYYPSSYDCANIVSVAATDSADALAYFSNYGATSVDLAAPGVGILSTTASDYESWQGTSMATPHVTGAIALCAARFPAETVSQRIARVLNGVDPVPGLSGTTSSGGRLNVQAALSGPVPSDDDIPDDIPGVRLTNSPVTSDIARIGDCDVFSFGAAAGRSIEISLTGAADTDIDLYLYAPGTSSIVGSGVVGSGSVASSAGVTYPETITYTATTTGVYYILVYGYDGTGAYQLTHNVDLVPPVTSVIGADSSWHRTPVTLGFNATDAGGSGFAYTEYNVDGTGFVRGAGVRISANGSHSVAYRSADYQGNIETAQTVVVNVDSGRPTTVALANVAVKKGKKATMRFRVNDVTPKATVTIKICQGRKVVKTLRVGSRATNGAQKYSWTCRLARARYTWKVYATDLAGNAQGKVGAKTLTVR
jgi:subtilisin family serine protease